MKTIEISKIIQNLFWLIHHTPGLRKVCKKNPQNINMQDHINEKIGKRNYFHFIPRGKFVSNALYQLMISHHAKFSDITQATPLQ